MENKHLYAREEAAFHNQPSGDWKKCYYIGVSIDIPREW